MNMHTNTHTHMHSHKHVKLNKVQWQLGKIAPINHLSDRSKFYLPAIHAVRSVAARACAHTHTRTHTFINLDGSVSDIGPLHCQILSYKHINSWLHFEAGAWLQRGDLRFFSPPRAPLRLAVNHSLRTRTLWGVSSLTEARICLDPI